MTAPEILAAIEPAYAQELGAGYPSEVPAGITAQAWDLALKPGADFAAEYVGRALACVGLDLGLDHFARLEVQDRAPVDLRGYARTHRRPRAYIVRALGWKGATP